MTPTESIPQAWQPLTFRGVAAFAQAPLTRLLLVQFIIAVIAAVVVVWFVRVNWFPIIGEAIGKLPAQGEIVRGRLTWTETSPQLLAEGHFLSLSLDLDHRGGVRSPAQIEIAFGREAVRFYSLFGYAEYAYPKNRIIEFNRPELESRWGAWRPPILGITLGVVVVSLLVTWALLATLYFSWAWLMGFYANRAIASLASWKLAGAAMMPGALLATAGIWAYGLGVLDIVKFLAVMGAHFVVGWVYLIASPLSLPKISPPLVGVENPFVPAEKKTTGESSD